MLVNFDKVFHNPSKKPLPKKYPCDKCEEKNFSVDNPYYISSKCAECVKNHEERSEDV